MASTINASTSPAAIIQTADGTGILSLQTAGTTAVTIDASQNVGIGTSSPSASNIAGASFVPGTSTVASMTGSNGSGQLLLGNNGNGSNLATNDSCGMIAFKGRFNSTFSGGNDIASIIGTYTGNGTTRSGAIRFLTLDSGTEAERMRINSSGNLLVATTTQLSSGRVCIDFNQSTHQAITMRNTNGSNGGNYLLFLNSSSNQAGLVGQTGATTVSYTTSSDYRLKENIVPMTGALDKIAQLKPVTYNWKVDGSNGQGFIAHELQTVVPDCVVGEKDAIETYTDEEGNEQTRIIPQSVDTSFLVATLTAAIQELAKASSEQQTLIVSQSELINSLTARVTALEAK